MMTNKYKKDFGRALTKHFESKGHAKNGLTATDHKYEYDFVFLLSYFDTRTIKWREQAFGSTEWTKFLYWFLEVFDSKAMELGMPKQKVNMLFFNTLDGNKDSMEVLYDLETKSINLNPISNDNFN